MVAVTRFIGLAAVLLLSLTKESQAARRFNRRSDLTNVPTINISIAAHWTVPLQGSRTCDPGRSCGLYHLSLDL